MSFKIEKRIRLVLIVLIIALTIVMITNLIGSLFPKKMQVEESV